MLKFINMKKFLSFTILFFALSSCSDDVKFNNVAVFQGVKDNVFWKGEDATATVSGTSITISAVTLIDNVTLIMPVPGKTVKPLEENTFITHTLGVNNARKALYNFADSGVELNYETGINSGDGEITISEYDGNFISGTFRFNAVNNDEESEAAELVNYQEGVFYKVPVTTVP